MEPEKAKSWQFLDPEIAKAWLDDDDKITILICFVGSSICKYLPTNSKSQRKFHGVDNRDVSEFKAWQFMGPKTAVIGD